jgi:hypothetical protein
MALVPRISRGSRSAAPAALVAVLWLGSGASVHAQTTSASVFGSVSDTQGGMLAGATVTLTSRTQAYTLTATTDHEGDFVFPIVRPDTYALRVSLEGFKTLERTNVVVNANDRFSAGVLTLEVGVVAEQVSVTGRVSELQAHSGERSYALENATITNIANNGRSLFGFTILVPGVVPNASNGGTRMSAPPEDASGFTANGQRANSNNMTVDGVSNLDTGNNGGFMATTNIDAVSEFKILTNAYQAEYGRAVGGQVQVVTRSGTQSFHGSGYWYGRRSDWNANTWTNKRAAAPPPVGSGQLIELPEASRNDFGYTIGGPVTIPGVFNEEKKKLFFFWSQEFQRRKDSVPELTSRVPTELERRGDFSQSVDRSGNPYPYIRDYTTGLPCNASDTRGCFQDGGVLGRIPQDRLWPPGLNALNIYPLPNTTGSSGINYRSQTPNDIPRREEMLRLDFQATDRWRFMGRYMQNTETQRQPYGTAWAGAGSNNLDTVHTVLDLPGRNWMLSATGILNATTSIEISVGSAHNEISFNLTNTQLRRSAAGLSDFPLLYPQAVQEDYMPWFYFTGGRVGSNAGYIETDLGPFRNKNTTYDALANLTKIRGPHTFKAGVYFQHSFKAQSAFASHNSGINFVDDASNPYDTGFGYANAAIGVFDYYWQASKYAMPQWVYKNFEFYVQDNWKATRRLTLDYGVRFYYLTPQWDRTLQASTFLPDTFSAANAARLYYPVCVGAYPCSGSARRGMDPALLGAGVTPTPGNTVDGRFIGRLVPGSDRFNGAFQAGQGINDTMQSGNAFRVSPRIGVVYDLTGEGKTILRGGFGIYYDRPLGNMVFNQITNAPGMLQPTLQWGRLQDISASAGDPDPTLTMQPTAYDFTPPKVYAWNVGVQHKLPHALVFDIAYVGSSSKNLLAYEFINAVPYGAKFLPESQDPTRAPSTVPGATALPDDFLRPYQGYNDIGMWGYKGYSKYHSLQTSLNRRFDNGLMFSVFYVWSKALGINDGDGASIRPNATEEELRRADYSYVNYDRPHTFVVNFIYQTPKVAKGALGVLANDWQLSGVYRWMSGTPYPINFFVPGISAANLTGSDVYQNARIVVTCDPGKGWSGDPYKQIDPSCFAPPQPGSLGMESARYFLHGPPVDNLDLSLSKSFAFGKAIRLEVRLDAFNALNHTQFTGVNNTAVFASLSNSTIMNPAYDANGDVVRNNGFGSVSGVRPARTLQLVTRLTF